MCYKWLDIFQDLVAAYNDTKHRTIRMKPKDVTTANVETLIQRLSQNNRRRTVPKFNIGDKVRVSKNKHVFKKGYTPNWTTEIFTVNRMMPTSPVTYKIKDYQDEPIAGGFYEEELLETKYPNVYLVEKVLKKRGDRAYVKWLGFASSQ